MQDGSSGGRLMTGMSQRQGFLVVLDQLALTPTKRPRTRLGALARVVVDDVDHAVTRLGPDAADELLDAAAGVLVSMMAAWSEHAHVARIDTYEFGILVPDATAQALADRLRTINVRTPSPPADRGGWALTISAGASAIVSGEQSDRALTRAGQALAQATSVGRAQIKVYDSSTHQFAENQLGMLTHIEELRRAVLTDSLTGVGNRTALDECLARLAAGGTGQSAVLFVDIDRFHSFNHVRGQEAGDEALRRVAAALSDTTRAADRVFRRGGEEFVVVLPGASRSVALRVAERHRQAVEDLAIPHGGTPQTPLVTVTICVGLASVGALAAAIERAAVTAFAAKDREARNVVLETGDEPPAPEA